MTKLQMTVRGKTRNVYLEKQNDDGTWNARTYVGPRSRTTVSGLYRKYANGSQRFTPTGINADLV